MLAELKTEWIQYILTNMEDAVCLTGMNGELLYANPAAERLFGLEYGRQVKIWDAIPYVEENDALIQLFIDGVMEKKRQLRSLVKYVNNEGEQFQLHVTLTCESSEAGMILIVIHDLTDLIKVHSAFARYTSPEIAQYVLTTPEGEKQGGQKKEVTILMSDLRGFTAMSINMSSDGLITMLNHYFESMAGVIRRFQGTVIEFLGDGIFVVFGAPHDQPNHAADAVSCAIEMQNAMTGVNAWNREHGYPELAMGIGINSGEVVVGNIGSDQKMKYGCMGEAVNLVGRLESLSLGGQVLISENTRNMISGELEIAEEKSFMPKGGRDEMKYFCITGIGRIHSTDGDPDEIRWGKLAETIPLRCYVLDGKTVTEESYAGVLRDISEDEKYGILTARCSLNPMQNLLLRIGDLDVYAKVMDCGEGRCRIGFTTRPEGFSKLIECQKKQ